MMAVATEQYTLDDTGCYVDGSRGIYMVDEIAEIARGHGMPLRSCNRLDGHEHIETYLPSEWAGCELSSEIADECSDYMNEHFPVDGAYWGYSEMGDWGLWENEDE